MSLLASQKVCLSARITTRGPRNEYQRNFVLGTFTEMCGHTHTHTHTHTSFLEKRTTVSRN